MKSMSYTLVTVTVSGWPRSGLHADWLDIFTIASSLPLCASVAIGSLIGSLDGGASKSAGYGAMWHEG